MKRIFWAMVGLGAGAVIGVQVSRWANQTKARYAPPNLAREAGGKLEQLKVRALEALAAGAEEMVQREAELREELGLPTR